jgi:hypothetical protein
LLLSIDAKPGSASRLAWRHLTMLTCSDSRYPIEVAGNQVAMYNKLLQ